MGDSLDLLVEVWADNRKRSMEKRAQNRSSSAQVLAAKGVQFVSHNAGAHLVVQPNAAQALKLVCVPTIDFWPGTGLWKLRGSPWNEGRGVRSLLKFLKA